MSADAEKGKLDVIIESINLTKDTSGWFSEMHPYVKVRYGDHEKKTRTVWDGGK